MITRIAKVYPIDFPKHNNPQSGNGTKKRQQEQFKNILGNLLLTPPSKPPGAEK